MNKEYFLEKFLQIQTQYNKSRYEEGNNLFHDFKDEFLNLSKTKDLLIIAEDLLKEITEPQLKTALSYYISDLLNETYGYEKTLDYIFDPACPFALNRRFVVGAVSNITNEEFIEYFSKHPITKDQAAKLILYSGKRAIEMLESINIPNEFIDKYVDSIMTFEEIDAMITHKDWFTKTCLTYNINEYINNSNKPAIEVYTDLLKTYPNFNSYLEPGILNIPLNTPVTDIERNNMLTLINSDSFINSTTSEGKDRALDLFHSSRFNLLNKGLRNNIVNLLLSYEKISESDLRNAILSFQDHNFCMSRKVCERLPNQYFNLFLEDEVLNKLDYESKMFLTSMVYNEKDSEESDFRKQLLFNKNGLSDYFPNTFFRNGDVTKLLTIDELKSYMGSIPKDQTYTIAEINPNYNEEEIMELLTNPVMYNKIKFNSILNLLKKISSENRIKVLNDPLFVAENIRFVDIDMAKYINYVEIKDNYLFLDTVKEEVLFSIVDRYLEDTKDLDVIKNPLLIKRLAGENSNKILNLVDLDKVIDIIHKSMKLSGSDKVRTSDIISFISLVASLQENAEEILSFGTIQISVRDIINFKDKMLYYSMNRYRRENAEMLDNIYSNALNALEDVSITDLERRMGLPKILTLLSEVVSPDILYSTLISLKNGNKVEQDLYEICEQYKKKLLTEVEEKESKRILEVLTHDFVLTPGGYKTLRDRVLRERTMEEKRKEVLNRINNNTLESSFLNEINGLLVPNQLGESETFTILMMEPIISGRNFDKETYLSFFGFERPSGYDHYLLDRRKRKQVESSQNSILRAMSNLDKSIIKKALLYVTGEIPSFEEKVNPTIISLLQREKHALEGMNVSLDNEDNIICSSYSNKYEESLCREYQSKEFIIERLNKLIFKYINSVDVQTPDISEQELNDQIKARRYELPLSEDNFKIKNSHYSPTEIGDLFSGFNFPYFLEHSGDKQELIDFLRRNSGIIKMLSSSLDECYIPGIGVSLSNFNRVKRVCKLFDIDMEHLDIVDFKRIYDNIAVSLNPYDLCIDRSIIRSICENDRFSVYSDPNERVERASNLMRMAITKQKKSIPIINSRYYETLDSHDPELLVSGIKTDACFRIGGNAHNILHYCALDQNGTIVYMKNSIGERCGRVFGIRRGNGLFLHQLQVFSSKNNTTDEELTSYLEKYAKDVIEASKETDEPIEFVSITDKAQVKLDDTHPCLTEDKCEYVTSPLNEDSKDFIEFLKTPGLKEDTVKPIYSNYAEGKTIIVESIKPIDELKIEDYEPRAFYTRKRNKPVIYDLSNIDSYRKAHMELEKILYLSSPSSRELDMTTLSHLTIGEDYIYALNKEGEEIVINLNYDERSEGEIEEVRSKYGRSNSQVL